ncbi:MAG: oligosaccharide flippase family protein [Spirochaetota bacterium]
MKTKEQSISQKIIRNTKFNIIGRFWTMIVGLLLTPYIISKLGNELFGIWAIISVITGFFTLLDFGIGSSFVKYISEFYTKKNYAKINEVINTGIGLYLIISILVLLFSVFFIDQILKFINIPVQYLEITKYVYVLSIILFCASNIISPIVSIQGGLQRLDITNKITIILSIPMAIGAVIFLENDFSINGLIYNSIILFLLNSLINIFIAFKIFPELKINLLMFNKKTAAQIWNYGYKLQIANISSQVSLNIDKVIITNFLSIGMVTYYQLGSSIIDKIKSFAVLIFTPIMPALVELEAKGERNKFIQGYTLGTKYLALIITPIFTFIIVTSPQIMAIWMGKGYERSIIVIIILGIGYLFAVLSGMRSIAIQATGKTHIEMWSGIIAMILNIPLSIIFVKLFGFSGVAIGTSIALFVSVIYGIIAFHRDIKLPIFRFLKTNFLNSFIICTFCGLCIVAVTVAIKHVIHPIDRISNLVTIIIQAVIFFSFYIAILFFTKPLFVDELKLLLEGRAKFLFNLLRCFCKS